MRKRPKHPVTGIPYNDKTAVAWIRRKKRVTKAFIAHNFTPLSARLLADVFCELSIDTEDRKQGMLGLITRIVNGKDR